MDVKWMLLIAVIIVVSGCRGVDVSFVAKYQHGPASVEVHGSPNGFAFK